MITCHLNKYLSFLLILFVFHQSNARTTYQVFLEVGNSRHEFGDDKGAIDDFSLAIEIDNNFLPAYLNRAASRYNLEDYYGAIEDYGKVIEMDPENVIALYGRGISQLQIKYFVGGCEDLHKDIELGYDFALEPYYENCRQGIAGTFSNTIIPEYYLRRPLVFPYSRKKQYKCLLLL